MLRRGGRARGGHRHGQNGIGAQAALIRRAVEVDHDAVEHGLLRGVLSLQCRGDFAVDVADRLQRSFAQIARLVAIAQLYGFLFAGGSAGRHSGPSHASVGQINIRLHRRIPAGIENFTSDDLYDIRQKYSS